jgi:hypothetical protein
MPHNNDGWTTGHADDGELGTTRAGVTADSFGAQVARIPAGYSPLEDLSAEMTRWTDLHCEALDAEAEAQVAYDDVYLDEIVKCHREKVQMAIIKDVTNGRCKAELATLTRASAAVKRTRAKVNEASACLTAKQSQMKWSGVADGGDR